MKEQLEETTHMTTTKSSELATLMSDAIYERITSPAFMAYDEPRVVREAIALLATELLAWSEERGDGPDIETEPDLAKARRVMLDEFVAVVSDSFLDEYEFKSKAA